VPARSTEFESNAALLELELLVKNMPETSPPKENLQMTSLAEFLESSPPDSTKRVDPVSAFSQQGHLMLIQDDVQLDCDSPECDGKGKLRFAYSGGTEFLKRGQLKHIFATYLCRNCCTSEKTFGVMIIVDAVGFSGAVYKLGEIPAFGPQVPARVITLIGSDRDLFLKGRRAENHGLGVGAFAYYRRVVENQKVRIIEEMARVAKKLEASQADLKLFEEAARESQFSKAIDKIGAAIPSALRVNGHNPLTLLHSALSDGLHERSDEECLECAREIRLLMTELADRMAQVLKEETELKGAVSKLLARTAARKTSTSAAVEPASNES
jgi:hypothetical protein